MNVRNRLLLKLFLVTFLSILVLAVPLLFLFRFYAKHQGAVAKEQAIVESVRQRGGSVVFGANRNAIVGLVGNSESPRDAPTLDFSHGVVDAEVMQTLDQFPGMETLNLDGAKLEPKDYAPLANLMRLKGLSLARSNFTDASISYLPLGLTSLSLNATTVTDKSMSRLAGMHGLVTLNIADTSITPAGLKVLERLRSLDLLWLDDSYLTAESVKSLQVMLLLEALSVLAHHSSALANEIALEYLEPMKQDRPVGFFATLLSPDTPDANRIVVTELLRDPDVTPNELVAIVTEIRDWRKAEERKK